MQFRCTSAYNAGFPRSLLESSSFIFLSYVKVILVTTVKRSRSHPGSETRFLGEILGLAGRNLGKNRVSYFLAWLKEKLIKEMLNNRREVVLAELNY